jgi:hypothetical protein
VLRRARARVAQAAGPATRKTLAGIGAVSQLARRGTRWIVARVVAAVPTGPADRWAVASLAALFLLVGVSAVVAASRGGANTLPPAKTLSANVRASAKVTTAHVAPTPVKTPAAVASVAPKPAPTPATAAPAASIAPPRPEPPPVVAKRHRSHRRVAIASKVPAGKVSSGKVAKKPAAPPKKAVAAAAQSRPAAAPARPIATPARPAPPPPARPAAPRPIFSR